MRYIVNKICALAHRVRERALEVIMTERYVQGHDYAPDVILDRLSGEE
jgi:hypothetical protein